jgi:hypothetical protein
MCDDHKRVNFFVEVRNYIMRKVGLIIDIR